MNKKYRADKVVIVKRVYLCIIGEPPIYELPFEEFQSYMNKPCLAYKGVYEVTGGVRYIPLLGTKPFDSYAEAEAARLQFIKDYCIEGKETFEI